MGLDSCLSALIAVRIASAAGCLLPHPSPATSGQIFRLTPSYESNGNKMKDDLKAPAEE